jgi:hypothetical protein
MGAILVAVFYPLQIARQVCVSMAGEAAAALVALPMPAPISSYERRHGA